MNPEVLRDSLERILLNRFNPNSLDRAKFTISLCNYYGRENMPPEVKTELEKLDKKFLDYELFDQLKFTLTEAVRMRHSKAIYFEHQDGPHHINQPEGINIINVNINPHDMILKLEALRNKLNEDPVDFTVLIQFISDRARAAGDF